jgi:transposase-like protein
MVRRKRRQFSPEFKTEAVRLVKVGDRNLVTVARDLDLTPSALREWVLQGKEGGEPKVVGSITSDEREELVRLRRENKRLLIEREILKKAAAFFAKENG